MRRATEVSNNAFVGRQEEMASLRARVDAAAAGTGGAVLLSGEPGIGKTRTTEELVAEAEGRGFRVLWGRCWEMGGAPAFWPWAQILRAGVAALGAEIVRDVLGASAADLAPLVRGLGARRPGLEPVTDSAEVRFRLFDAVLRCIECLSRSAPLLIAIDDLHGADPSSLLLLQFLIPHIRALSVLIVGAYRDSGLADRPLAAVVAETLRERCAQHISLRGLSHGEVKTFLELRAGVTPAPALVTALHRSTEGNPFFLSEFVNTLRSEQHDAAVAHHPVAGPRAMSQSVKAAIALRLQPLSGDARRVLELAAVIGREFSLPIVERAMTSIVGTGEPGAVRVADLLALAAAHGLILPQPEAGGLRFAHALVRQALYDDVKPSERAAMHRHIATAMEQSLDADAHLAELAHHFLAAGAADDSNKRAVLYARRAGDAAMGLRAYEEAARLYALGVGALERNGDAGASRQLCDLLLAMGEARNGTGDITSAKHTFLRAATVARGLGDRTALSRAALGYAAELAFPEQGAVDDVHVGLVESAIATWGNEDHELHARLLARLATVIYFSDQAARRVELCDRAIAMARRRGDPRTLAQVLMLSHGATWGPNPRQRLAITDELGQLAHRLGDHGLAYHVHQWRFSTVLDLGDRAAVDAELEVCKRLAAEQRQPFQIGWLKGVASTLACLEGRFEDAESALNDFVMNAKGMGKAVETLYGMQLYFLRSLQGRHEELIDPIRAAVAMNPGIPALRAAFGLLLAETGRAGEARAEIADALATLDRIPFGTNVIPTLVHLAHICALVGDRENAAAVYRQLAQYDGLSFSIGAGVGYFGAVAHYLGMAAATAGHPAAAGHFEDAVAQHQCMRARPFVALSQYEYAALLLATQPQADRRRARQLAQAALTSARELGMQVLEPRATALVTQVGRRRRPESQKDVRATHPGPGPVPLRNAFVKVGDLWEITYAGTATRLEDSRGLQYLAQLLRHPGQQFHVLDLAQRPGAGGQGSGGAGEQRGRGAEAHAGSRRPGTADQGLLLLDAQAKAEYRQRLLELRSELAEADDNSDRGTVERARGEIEMISAQLAGALGLGGRDRLVGAAVERARVAVTKRIKAALRKIQTAHPPLAAHLKGSITTGYICAYMPVGPAPTWEL